MKSLFKYFILLAVSVTAFSCFKDNALTSRVITDGENVQAGFVMAMPASSGDITGTDSENRIESVWVIAFRVDGSNEYFDYVTRGTSITNISTDKKRFAALLKIRDYRQRFVLIANAADKIQELEQTSSGKTKDEVLSALEHSRGTAWASSPSSAFSAIPMWGESETMRVDGTDSEMGTIKMLRMVAKVDVVLTTAAARDNFKPRELYLYNYHDRGRITPSTDPGKWDNLNYRALSVTMPSSDASKIRGPLSYSATVDNGTYTLPSIYAYESTEAAIENALEATCLVVGGIYGDDTGLSYYRLDLFEKDDKGISLSHMELVRNHMYKVMITSVDGRGKVDPDQAFESKDMNMTVHVLDWEEGEIGDAVFDGQYMLGVSKGIFELSRESSSEKITVITNVPAGWEATVDAQYDWLSIESQNSAGINQKGELCFSVRKNESDATRVGYIDIRANRLIYRVKVVQSKEAGLCIDIWDNDRKEISELVFRCFPGLSSIAEQSYTVSWACSDGKAHVRSAAVGAYAFDPCGGDDPASAVSLSSSPVTYSVKPDPMEKFKTDPDAGGDPFLVESTKITYMVSDGGDMIAKGITLIHKRFDLIPDPSASYVTDGSSYYFDVRSNGTWTVKVISDPDDMLKSLDTKAGGINTGTGVELHFTTNDHTGSATTSREAILEFTVTIEDGSQFTVLCHLNGINPTSAKPVKGANCYIISPGSDGIMIPVDWANGDDQSDRILSGDRVNSEFLWTDHPAGMADNAAVSAVYVVGDGPSSRLVVVPGTSEGNAVVAVSVEDEIRWSWHIWVTSYNPDNDKQVTLGPYQWMDRNLGALTAGANNTSRSFGLFYQWGRKDPFPPLATNRSENMIEIYDEEGESTEIYTLHFTGYSNLENSIESPMVFILGNSVNNSDWYSSETNVRRNDLWGPDTKSHYDPCPEGWKVPHDPSSNQSAFFGMWSASWDATNYGNMFTDLGYWPSAGRINGYTGNMELKHEATYSVSGYYWGASPATNNGNQARFMNSRQNACDSNLEHRSHGHNVRCIQE